MTDYILEFEYLYCKVEYEIKLPDAVLAFKLCKYNW